MITSSRICEIAEVPSTTLADWVAKGFVIPAVPGGVGRGNSHRFTVAQAVGVAVAAALTRSERRCSPEYVRRVVSAFGGVSEPWLVAEFRKRHTHFVAVHADKPLLRGSQEYESVNVAAIYDRVKASAAAV